MCLILFAYRAHADYPLVLAANRDEDYARPAAAAGFWEDHPAVCGGRDLERGGTWLGLSRGGRFAAVTNYRDGLPRRAGARSRGELTRDYLVGAQPALAYLEAVRLRAADYSGFGLIVGDLRECHFLSNRDGALRRIDPGIYGLSNHLLDTPWPKVERGKRALRAALAGPVEVAALHRLLADREPAPAHELPRTGVGPERERELSPLFIAGERYGTRASTVVRVRRDGEVVFSEHRFGAAGCALGETLIEFRLDPDALAGVPRAATPA
jgi:uncharacterized protein with NRDE domain